MRFAILILMVVALGCDRGEKTLAEDCERICGYGHAHCAYASSDEPQGGTFRGPVDENGPATDFTIKYTGMLCEFEYINRLNPKLNWKIGAKRTPQPVAAPVPAPVVEEHEHSEGEDEDHD